MSSGDHDKESGESPGVDAPGADDREAQVDAPGLGDPTLPDTVVTRDPPGAGSGPSPAPTALSRSSGSSVDGAQFAPGTLLDGRYRLVAMLGRGGMGEVYRAEDLKLGETVAVKFLPERLSLDAGALARFHREVRVARQIAHRNVCRVHDIGEAEGYHFLTMEYIDGEDLSVLLRRIGHLPEAKAVDLAREICAGLAAAHDAGILHRDLKPANVMIDGRGRAKITDFGLATLQEELRQDADASEGHFVGTPAYMAPEQFRGEEPTQRTDLYSLGLVLYEMFTGESPFPQEDWRQIVARGGGRPAPKSPRAHVPALDRRAEATILRCLESEPAKRPKSALDVAVSLPGGDPLRAALEAGETPSPEMVAGAEEQRGALTRRVGLALLSLFLVSLVVTHFLGRFTLLGLVEPEKSGVVLEDRARTFLQQLGWSEERVDHVGRFRWEAERIGRFAAEADDRSAWARRARERPALLTYRYRQSTRPIVAPNPFAEEESQAPLRPGDAVVVVDGSGRLDSLRLHSVGGAEPGEPDWGVLFALAEIDPADLRRRAEPPVVGRDELPLHDRRWLWEGRLDGRPVQVDGASFGSLPVYFSVHRPTDAEAEELAHLRRGPLFWLAFLVVLALAGFLAFRNVRDDRADIRGGTTLGLALAATSLLGSVLLAHHVGGAGEVAVVLRSLMNASFGFALGFVIYAAIEPLIRARAPELLISWTRLLRGRWRDPLVGRDVLCAFGIGLPASLLLIVVIPLLTGDAMPWTFFKPGAKLGSFSELVGIMFFGNFVEAIGSLTLGLALALLLAWVRRTWLAAGLLIGLASVAVGLSWTPIVLVGILARFGVLATAAVWLLSDSLLLHPTTVDPAHWWAWPNAWLPSLVLVGIAVMAFRSAVADGGTRDRAG